MKWPRPMAEPKTNPEKKSSETSATQSNDSVSKGRAASASQSPARRRSKAKPKKTAAEKKAEKRAEAKKAPKKKARTKGRATDKARAKAKAKRIARKLAIEEAQAAKNAPVINETIAKTADAKAVGKAPEGAPASEQETHGVTSEVTKAKSHEKPKAAKRSGGKPKHDPHADREAQMYDNPIPSREFILELLTKEAKPMTRERIADALGLDSEDHLEAIRRRLRAMERDGQLVFNRRGGYLPLSMADMVKGRVTGHRDGFGFLAPDEGGDDLFLGSREMASIMHGDRVVARVVNVDRRGRREGAVVEILERAHTQLVGHFLNERGIGVVSPDNKRIAQDIMVLPENQMDAVEGQVVMVEILEHPTKHRAAMGRVIEIMGDRMAPGMEIDIAIRAHDLPNTWSDSVQNEIAGYDGEVPESAKEGRVDLRKVPLVTIDGADARDFDDAVFCSKTPKGWKLLVAIADVSHYVEPETALDVSAQERATSVYFPGQVIPMLPEVLSNGLCSINPDVDRLCMVAEMTINAEGKVIRSKFMEAVMRSHARLIYDDVGAMLSGKAPKLVKQHKDIFPHLKELNNLYKVLRKARDARGAIDFESVETQIQFGEDRKIEAIVPVFRNDAHKIIEECMLLANQVAARFLLRKKIPALYRIHAGPAPEKVEDLRSFLGEVGLQLGGGPEASPSDFTKLLKEVKDRPDAHLIQTVMMRTLKQAVYSPDNIGHFGLAFDEYAHFTSPIRRYPDLLVHRAIRHVIRGGKASDFEYSHDKMAELGVHCSTNERRADEATRDATDWLKCEYLMDKVGETYEGVIKSVTSFGLFIELADIYVEGLVHITALKNDYYKFDPVHHRLNGERTGHIYRLGDRIEVTVARVDLDQKKIDFDLPENIKAMQEAETNPEVNLEEAEPPQEPRKSSNRGRRRSRS